MSFIRIQYLFLPLIIFILAEHPVSAQTSTKPGIHASLMQKVEMHGRYPVIIHLDTGADRHFPGIELPDAAKTQRERIRETRQSLLGRINEAALSNIKLYNNLPYLAATVDVHTLQDLLAQSEVKAVYPDIVTEPMLTVTAEHIGAKAVHAGSPAEGYTGEGTVIAILDTGMEPDHPFYSDRIIQQACFSSERENDEAGYRTQSLCPNGETTQIGGDAGRDCDPAIGGCGHGTHVGGIAAGNSPDATGIAPGAEIISIQVFSIFNEEYCNGKSCVLSFTTDQLRAVDWLLDQYDQGINIVAVNLSLGSEHETGLCDDLFPPYTDAVQQLLSRNIATIAAAGNFGNAGALAFPSCISSVVSVGATQITGDESMPDAVLSLSNSASTLDLFAPGFRVFSSITDGDYGVKSGTSMAAPHVTGAWALMREANPGATVDEVRHRFITSGVPVTDSRSGMVLPRIQADAAIFSAPEDLLPQMTIQQENLNFEIPQGHSDSSTLELSNTGTGLLYWHAGISGESDAEWLSANPVSGAVPGQTAQQLTLTVDSEGLEDGVYEATIVLSGNDLTTPELSLTVILTVQEAAAIRIVEGSGMDGSGDVKKTYSTFDDFLDALLSGDLSGSLTAELASDLLVASGTSVTLPLPEPDQDGIAFLLLTLPEGIQLILENDARLVLSGGTVLLAKEESSIVGDGLIEVESGAFFLNRSSSDPLLMLHRSLYGNAGWRLLSLPVSEFTLSEFLEPIWTQGVDAGGNTGNGTPNVYRWDKSASGSDESFWVPVKDLTETEVAGDGLLVYVFADDNADGNDDPFPKRLSVTGHEFPESAASHNVSSNDAWTLLGNPFASALRFEDIQLGTGLTGSVYVWDAGGAGSGDNASGSWKTYSVDGSIGDLTDGLIAPFQAFFVQNDPDYSGDMTESSVFFSNNAKSTNLMGTRFLFRQKTRDRMRLELAGNDLNNALWLQFSDSGDESGPVSGDALQLQPLAGDFAILAAQKQDGSILDIGHFPVPGIRDHARSGEVQTSQSEAIGIEIPLHVQVSREGQYQIRVTDLDIRDLPDLHLTDLYDNKTMTITGDLVYTFDIHEDTKVGSGREQHMLTGRDHYPGDGSREIKAPASPFELQKERAKRTDQSSLSPRFLIHNRLPDQVASQIPEDLPSEPVLHQNYPNPFNPSTRIRFSMPESGHVTLTVYDAIGRSVAVLLDDYREAGHHRATWNAADAASGIYILRLQVPGNTLSRSMLLVR